MKKPRLLHGLAKPIIIGALTIGIPFTAHYFGKSPIIYKVSDDTANETVIEQPNRPEKSSEIVPVNDVALLYLNNAELFPVTIARKQGRTQYERTVPYKMKFFGPIEDLYMSVPNDVEKIIINDEELEDIGSLVDSTKQGSRTFIRLPAKVAESTMKESGKNYRLEVIVMYKGTSSINADLFEIDMPK